MKGLILAQSERWRRA